MAESTETRHKVSLTPTQSTLLLTLYARAVDAQQPVPLVKDTLAIEVLEKIEHDPADLKAETNAQTTILLRASQFDVWTGEFLASHPEATVLHLACGLDSRFRRVKWGPGVRWIDVDFPDVVDLREKVYEPPEGADYRLIRANVTEEGWLEQVPTDRPTAVVFEGLTPYLDQETVTALIRRLVDRFPAGSQLIFDTVGPATIYFQSFIGPIRKSGATLTWAADDPATIESLHPRLKLLDAVRPPQMSSFGDLPWMQRMSMYTINYIPYLRNFGLYMRFEF